MTSRRGEGAQQDRRLEDFPELQTVNQTACIHEKVQARYNELEKANVQGKGAVQELVEFLGSNDNKSKEKGQWPQDHVYMGVRGLKPTYEQLNELAWMLGFLRQRQIEKDETIKENMIEYLIELLQESLDFGWPAAKGAHHVLVHSIIDRLTSWADLESVKKIRERFARTPNTQVETSSMF